MPSPALRPHTAEIPVGEQFPVSVNPGPSNGKDIHPLSSNTDTNVAVDNTQEDEVSGGLIRVDRTYYHSGTDQHDYETKFAEDKQFEEMAPMARVFKMSLEEYAKLDGDKVEDWRDGLDVLLVFAGVFSAVVSTLVGQTSSKLQVDFGEVSAHLMTEMVLLQRAAMNNLPDSSVPVSDVTLTSALRVSSTDTWVNGLWFTSLALSLAAALIAVLTKQWIHQFLTSTSGTAQDRLRIRQFRYEQLREWHVPLIIGMLPIFMHISLGAFLAGLVVYVRALSTPIAVAVGVIAFAAFVVYFGTNLHPVFYPASPYKTFLTRYTYRFYHGICERLTNVHVPMSFIPSSPTFQSMSVTVASAGTAAVPLNSEADDASPTASSEELSLERVETLMVDRVAFQLDARAISDLYNLSSNTCVKSIILQSFSNLPLQTVSIVAERIPNVDKTLAGYIQSVEYTLPEKQTSFERLFRAHLRIRLVNKKITAPAFFMPDLTPVIREPTALDVLLRVDRSSSQAADYLRKEILRKDKCAYHDIVSWARILQRALHGGSDWLDIENYESPVWQVLLSWLIRPHGCKEDTACHCSFVELVTLPIREFKKGPGLTIREYPGYPTTRGVLLTEVIARLMRISITDYMLKVSYTNACAHEDFKDLPSDILLNLAIIQSPKFFLTSRSSFVYGDKENTTMTFLLRWIRQYLGAIPEISAVEGGTLKCHPGVVRASFHSLFVAMKSPRFIDGSLTSDDERVLVAAFTRTLSLDNSLFLRACEGITRPVLDVIMVAAFDQFSHVVETSAIIMDVLRAHTLAGKREDLAFDIGIEFYSRLVVADWLTVLDDNLSAFLDPESRRDCADRKGRIFEHYYMFTLLAVAFVDGLETLSAISDTVYTETCMYIQGHAIVLYKLLMLADEARRDRLWILALLLPEIWNPSIGLVKDFTASTDFRVLYDAYKATFHLGYFYGRVQPEYGPRDDYISALWTKFEEPVEPRVVALSFEKFNTYTVTAIDSSAKSFETSLARRTASFCRIFCNNCRDVINRIRPRKAADAPVDQISIGIV